ncbi:MAG: 4Fe-4S binding protein [Desulforegulaceae bacterium]|nr:4Fe-4S binding protein [Desulforegulaceae bacterium]
MEDNIYKKLANHLDSLPGGYPETKSGVEIKILKLLFTREEAKTALLLNLIAENCKTIAFRADKSVEETFEILEQMASKGLILRNKEKNKEPKYMALQYVVGIWEFQVNRLTPKLLEYMEEHIPHLLDVKTWKKNPQMRTIPIGESIDNSLKVMTYENAYELVEKKENFVISPCICRMEMRLQGKGCNKPIETCISFGDEEDFYVKNNIGRRATKQEVLDVLKLANKKGLVLQPSNGKDIHWLCCCCGCCCGILRTVKTYPKPSHILSSPFRAVVSNDSCTGCKLCLKRCPMDAIEIKDKKVKIDYDKCIGCGLCVSTCPSKTLKLERKPKGTYPKVSQNIVTSSLKTLHARGKTSPMELSKMIGKSFFDRYKSKK